MLPWKLEFLAPNSSHFAKVKRQTIIRHNAVEQRKIVVFVSIIYVMGCLQEKYKEKEKRQKKLNAEQAAKTPKRKVKNMKFPGEPKKPPG